VRGELKVITFDVGNTLIFPEPSVGEVYARAAGRHGVTIDSAVVSSRFASAWRAQQASRSGLVYGRTHGEARAFWLAVIRSCFADNPQLVALAPVLVDELYATFGRAAAWRLAPEWGQVLQACRRRGLRIGLVSNWDIRLRGLLAEFGLLEVVDSVIISAEYGAEKPDPAIFRFALAELGCLPSEAVHVGDSWQEDVVGAQRAGLSAVWYNPDGAFTPERQPGALVVSALRQIPVLLLD